MRLHRRVRPFRSSPLVLSLILVSLAPLASAAGVRVIDPSGVASFATIQAAVGAAPEGALVLVGPGTHPGFWITGKSVDVVAARPGTVTIHGIVRVISTASNQDVLLSGLRVANDSGSNVSALRIGQGSSATRAPRETASR